MKKTLIALAFVAIATLTANAKEKKQITKKITEKIHLKRKQEQIIEVKPKESIPFLFCQTSRNALACF